MVVGPWLRSHDEGCTGVLRTSRNTLSSSLPLLPGKCAVVSAFKNPDSWLKSLCQRQETGFARRRERRRGHDRGWRWRNELSSCRRCLLFDRQYLCRESPHKSSINHMQCLSSDSGRYQRRRS